MSSIKQMLFINISLRLYIDLLINENVLNTILYNSDNRIKNEVNKGLRKTSTSSASSTISSAPRPYTSNNTSAVAPSNNDALFDRKIDLITEGIGSFFAKG